MPERRHGRPDDELRADREHDARAWRAHHHQGSVLLVDCLPDEQAMYELVLRRSGFDPIVTCNAQAAFEQAVSRQPSVIVVDVTIPDGGLALTERLRADARTRAVIIIVISGL